MATKIIKALVNGVVQNIEVEDITSPNQPLSVDERVDILENKHKVVITDGNMLVGNGTSELKEMAPNEVLEHINGSSIELLTKEEFENLGDDFNANILYLQSDGDNVDIYIDNNEPANAEEGSLWIDLSADGTISNGDGSSGIYIQNEEPTNAEDGSLWVDLDADGSTSTSNGNGSSGGSVNLDTTLTKSGYAADAKAVGDKFIEFEQKINSGVTVSDDGNGNITFDTITSNISVEDDGYGNIIIS